MIFTEEILTGNHVKLQKRLLDGVCVAHIFSFVSVVLSCSVRLYLQLFIGECVYYLRYLYLLAHSGVQHILCCVFALLFFILCTQFLWNVIFDCPSVLSNVYLDHNGSLLRMLPFILLIIQSFGVTV